jgi:hypothetical protein
VGTFFDSLKEQLSDPKAYAEKHGRPKAERVRKEAEKMDKRAVKMSKKHLRGNIRARNAATTADNLHGQADRLSVSPEERKAMAAETEQRRLAARRENFKRTGRYEG